MKRISTVALATALMACAAPASAQVVEGQQWWLRMIGAQAAYDRGYTGAGVTVGVMDSGIDPNHPEVACRPSPMTGSARPPA